MRPLIHTLLVISLLVPNTWAADEPATHAAKETDETVTETDAPQPKNPTTQILTRQEALIQSLRKMDLSPEALTELRDIVKKNPDADEKKFAKLVDDVKAKDKTLFTDNQARDVKKLFETELGPVKDKEKAREFGTAVARVIEAKAPTGDPHAKKSEATTKADPETHTDQGQGGAIADAGLSKFGQQLAAGGPGEGNKALLDRLDALASKLGKNPQDGGQGERGLGSGLLDRLLSRRGREGDRDRERGGERGGGPPPGGPPPGGQPPGGDRDRDRDRPDPSQNSKNNTNKNFNPQSNNSSNGNSKSDNAKGETTNKKSDIDLSAFDGYNSKKNSTTTKKDDTKSPLDNLLAKAGGDGTDPIGNTKVPDVNSLPQKTSPLNPIPPFTGGMPNAAFAANALMGAGGAVGGAGGYPFGGGSVGALPASGPSGGGDPFAGVGYDAGANAAPQMFTYSKPVGFGESANVGSGDYDASSSFDSTTTTTRIVKNNSVSEVIDLGGTGYTSDRSAISWIGRTQQNICSTGIGKNVGVCQKLRDRQHLVDIRRAALAPS